MPKKTKNGKSSAEYYAENKESLAKKRAYQREYNKKPEQVKKRVELASKNRKAGTYGNGDGKDYDHATNRMTKASTNRGRTGRNSPGTSGDRRARGGKKK